MPKFRKFSGTPESYAGLHPWNGPGPLCPQGIYLGRNLRSGNREYFDPWWLKQNGIIDATNCAVLGKRGFGKSAWGKTVTPRLSMLQAGQRPDGLGPEDMRIWLSNRKPEGGAAEVKEVADFLGSPVWELRHRSSFNTYATDMGLSPWDFMEVGINQAEFSAGMKLTNFQPLALQVGMSKMLRLHRDVSSDEVVAATLRGLTLADVNAYFKSADEAILNTYQSAFTERPELENQLNLVLNLPHHVPEQEFLRDAALVAAYIQRVTGGDFGGIFGGAGSPRKMLTQRLLAIDWSGTTEKGRSWADAMLWKWLSVALDNNDLALIPHINLGDEEHEVMSSLPHARFMTGFLKKLRAFHTFDIRITQFITDISEVGTEGSELRSLAETIARSFGFYVVFRQPEDDKTALWLASLGTSDLDIQACFQLPIGCCALIVPDQEIPIRFYEHEVMPIEQPLIKSNSVVDRMMERYPIHRFSPEAATGFGFAPKADSRHDVMMGVG